MSESTQEPFIALRDVPGVVRRMTGEGKNPHSQTVRRWYVKGVKGITLEVCYVGGTIYTTERMLQTFFAEIARAKSLTRSETQPQETTAARNRRARDAKTRLLKRLGK